MASVFYYACILLDEIPGNWLLAQPWALMQLILIITQIRKRDFVELPFQFVECAGWFVKKSPGHFIRGNYFKKLFGSNYFFNFFRLIISIKNFNDVLPLANTYKVNFILTCI